MTIDQEWEQFRERWLRLVEAMADRVSEDELEDLRTEGRHAPPCWAISGMLGGHELGMWELTAEEEDEVWELASFMQCRDDELLSEELRAKSTRNRPIRKVRVRFPLRGGGHGARSGLPGKRVFPERWSDDAAIAHTMDVARAPDVAVKLPTEEWLAHGERDGVRIAVIVMPDGDVLTAYPVSGSGVAQNPMDEAGAQAAARLSRLLDAVLPADHEMRAAFDELHAVGEWPYVIAGLRALDLPMSSEQRAELLELAGLSYREPE